MSYKPPRTTSREHSFEIIGHLFGLLEAYFDYGTDCLAAKGRMRTCYQHRLVDDEAAKRCARIDQLYALLDHDWIVECHLASDVDANAAGACETMRLVSCMQKVKPERTVLAECDLSKTPEQERAEHRAELREIVDEAPAPTPAGCTPEHLEELKDQLGKEYPLDRSE